MKIIVAAAYAAKAHANQVRKYTGAPYIVHPRNVAALVASVGFDEDVVSAAWLHDVLEDCMAYVGDARTFKVLFGPSINYWVTTLTNNTVGNRAERKAKDLVRLGSPDHVVHSIKCADIIDNTSDIVLHDPKFASTYLREVAAVYDVLTEAHPVLRQMAKHSITAGMETLQT